MIDGLEATAASDFGIVGFDRFCICDSEASKLARSRDRGDVRQRAQAVADETVAEPVRRGGLVAIDQAAVDRRLGLARDVVDLDAGELRQFGLRGRAAGDRHRRD